MNSNTFNTPFYINYEECKYGNAAIAGVKMAWFYINYEECK